ncbi:glycosyltransferase family 39 protein [Arenibaculum sp.]|jgi:4-amino-4-deoxy-L-arabinose transferase-like glycosyltransferase|uniref:glycosyltransferase family 39 protein n=1 Tax=Arenibaculum sp. TaxID=2865862 RepID=UPI002E138D5A|nr:glycosyltransferase family 39 protein [Arenibaculum sp.]
MSLLQPPAPAPSTAGGLREPDAGGLLTPSAATRLFQAFLVLHVAVWTLVPALTHPNLPLDVIEGLAWGREWQFGYLKHPPLSAWLMELAARLGGGADWPLYLLSQVAIAVAFWAVWRLSRELFTPARALLAVLLLEAVYFHNFTSPEFNANVVMLPFWALTVLALRRALETGSPAAWAAAGLAAGLGFLGKYFFATLLVPAALLLLAVPGYRAQLLRPGPYVGLLVFLAVLAPHLAWLVANDFPTFGYAMARGGGGETGWADHVVNPLSFLGEAAGVALPALVLVLLLGRPRPRSAGRADVFLLAVGIGPVATTALISALFGFELRSMWSTPLFLLLGPMLVAWLAPDPTRAGLRRFAAGWSVLFVFAALAYVAMMVAGPYVTDRGKRGHFPGEPLALAISSAWEERHGAPLPVVVGDEWLAGTVAWYAPSRPSTYIAADPRFAPWLDDAAVARSGAILVWGGGRRGEPAGPLSASPFAGLADRFPGIEEQPPLTVPWSTGADLPPVEVGWAIVPPKP